MMRADLESLGRRAVAAPGWRWLPGMAAIGRNGAKCRIYMGYGGMLCAQGEGDAGGYVAGWSNEWAEILGALPDLSDPATVGCLLALVREKWGNPTMIQRRYGGGWILTQPPIVEVEGLAGMLDKIVAQAPTEVEVLVLGLEGRK